jgi:hypothetical protein
VKNGTIPIYCFEDDLKILEIIDSIENQVIR